MQDLREYSNKELSLTVFNTHDLYIKLMSYWDNKIDLKTQLIQLFLDNNIIYNNAQWDYLINDIKSHFNELNSNK
jgi:hypothetical protein|tara:strand:+ start:540 stop:764 length:225 start_codon:yes stop_codon:yes gene_type:complete